MGSWLLSIGVVKVLTCRVARAMCQWLLGLWAESIVLCQAKVELELLTLIC